MIGDDGSMTDLSTPCSLAPCRMAPTRRCPCHQVVTHLFGRAASILRGERKIDMDLMVFHAALSILSSCLTPCLRATFTKWKPTVAQTTAS